MPDANEPNDSSRPSDSSLVDMTARAMRSERLAASVGDGWEPPEIEEVALLFPSYEVLRLLRRGDIGVVYQARQTALDRLVAIKLLPLVISNDEVFAERFRHEARAMARLIHPNIVAVYDFGTTAAGHLFIVMEYVAGATLQDIIHRPAEVVADITNPGDCLAPDQALSIIEQVCTALSYAHAHGIVHRDLKPAKVLIDTEGQAKITDFGLSTRRDEASAPAVVDTPGYMAPEQVNGAGGDRRTDIYRLGVMLYEMLCRDVPAEIFAPLNARIGCDTRIDAIVLQAIQQSPERRYQSAQEMQSAVASARVALTAPAYLPAPNRLAPPARLTPTAPVAPGKSKVPLYATLTGVVAALALAYAHFTKPTEEAGSSQTQIPVQSPSSASDGTTPDSPTPPQRDATAVAANAVPTLTTASKATPSREIPSDSRQPESGVEKWLADVDGPRQAAFQKQVTEPFIAGLDALRKRYLAEIDARQARAAATGSLDQALIWHAERELLEKGQTALPDAPPAPPPVRALRAEYRQRLAQIEAERAKRVKPLSASYDAILRKNLMLLTQRERIDDAQRLKEKREEIARTWLNTPETDQLPDPLRLFVEAVALRPLEPDAGGWVDLLSALTPAMIATSGNGWRLVDGELLSPDGKYATLPLPGKFATASYQLRVKVRQLTPKDAFHVVIPVGDRLTGFELDGFKGEYTGLFMVNEKGGKDLPGVVEGKQVKDSAPHDLEISVRLDGTNAKVTTMLDARPLYEWTGPIAGLSQYHGWATTPRGSLALGTVAGDWAVSEVKVKRLAK